MNNDSDVLEQVCQISKKINPLFPLYPTKILRADAALQLKEKGYDAVVAIKNAGILYGRIFEMMGYVYSEIDFSHYKREMIEPVMEDEELQKLAGKKVILSDHDIATGRTLERVTEYLRDKGIKVDGMYLDFLGSLFSKHWRTDKNGLRRLNLLAFKLANLEFQRFPKSLEIYTHVQQSRMIESAHRVLDYLMGKI